MCFPQICHLLVNVNKVNTNHDGNVWCQFLQDNSVPFVGIKDVV